MVERLNAGTGVMNDLKTELMALREDFNNHVKTNTRWIIAILTSIILTFITVLGSVYVTSLKAAQQGQMATSKSETTEILREIVEIMKKDRP